jgi:hypothetical protein
MKWEGPERTYTIDIARYTQSLAGLVFFGGMLVPFAIALLIFRLQNQLPFSTKDFWIENLMSYETQVTPRFIFWSILLLALFARIRGIRALGACISMAAVLALLSFTFSSHSILARFPDGHKMVVPILFGLPAIAISCATAYCSIRALTARRSFLSVG